MNDTDRSCEIGGHRWDLRYSARALRALQLIHGSLPSFVANLVGHSMGKGLPIETQAMLVWAGQIAVEPKLKRGKVEALLRSMDPRARHLLVTWAAADCTSAILQIAGAEIARALPFSQEDGGDE